MSCWTLHRWMISTKYLKDTRWYEVQTLVVFLSRNIYSWIRATIENFTRKKQTHFHFILIMPCVQCRTISMGIFPSFVAELLGFLSHRFYSFRLTFSLKWMKCVRYQLYNEANFFKYHTFIDHYNGTTPLMFMIQLFYFIFLLFISYTT